MLETPGNELLTGGFLVVFLLFQPIFHLFRISPAGNGERRGFAWEKKSPKMP